MLDAEAQANTNRERTAEVIKLTQAVIDRINEQIKKNQELLDQVRAKRKARGEMPPAKR